VTAEGRHCAHESDTHGATASTGCGDNPAVVAQGWLNPEHDEWATVDAEETAKERATIKDACCYTKSGHYSHGRPVHAESDRSVVTASIATRGDWSARLPLEVSALSPETRERIGAGFLEDGLLEHASVAEFSRFALSLMSVGAPAELVEAAHRAALDEIRHARVSFGIASVFLGREVGPGALALERAEPLPASPTALVATTLRDGCIGETIASLLVAVAARSAEGALSSALSAIADDERDHAALAYAVVKWAIESASPAERVSIGETIDAVIAEASAEPNDAVADGPDDSRYGRLSAEAARGVHRAGLAQVVVPALAALRALV
jgi:hypothetical protein